jgi:uncharacterized repeat protein (TIGR03843 family)
MTEPAGMERAFSAADELVILETGEVELKGRVLPASNLTFFGEVVFEQHAVPCVYKPVSGERPLWDFPDGTLAAREVAAYVVSQFLGWNIVPTTLLRDGPVGPGMVQVWREPDAEQDPVDIVPLGDAPDGYLHVLDAVDAHGQAVSLVHEDTEPLRRMAVFDALVNNADRKGGHVLPMPDGHRYGVDHGVCFHVQSKLRTVLWGWADEPLHPDDAQSVARFAAALADPTSDLSLRLGELLHRRETDALARRCDALLTSGRMPMPSGDWPAIPWPAF